MRSAIMWSRQCTCLSVNTVLGIYFHSKKPERVCLTDFIVTVKALQEMMVPVLVTLITEQLDPVWSQH